MLSVGLVLTGGGARGAYQAGVLKAIAEIASANNQAPKYDIISGLSAGAINAGYIAAEYDQRNRAAHLLCRMWEGLSPENIYNVDVSTLGKIVSSWISDLSLGGLYKKKFAHSLLDTAPLRELLGEHLVLGKIQKHIDAGELKAFSCAAYNYNEGRTISFVQGGGYEPWESAYRRSEDVHMSVDHIMASAAVPVLFPQTKVQDDFFSDGSFRNPTPIGSAINLGAEKLLVIGVRHWQERHSESIGSKGPTIGRIFGLMLNSLFFDLTDVDLERVQNTNEMLKVAPAGTFNYKPVETLYIRPSQDIGAIAEKEAKRFPRTIRYLLAGLGTRREYSELASYLLFDSGFTSQLVELGFKDGLAQRGAIEGFFGY